MADYVPLFKPGQAVTSQASAAVTGGQLLHVTGDGTVGPATAASAAWVGVAAQDAAAGGDQVGYYCGGVQRITASGAVTAGNLLVAGAAGTVAALAAVTTPTAADVTNTRAIVGIALTTAADGALVEVRMER